MASEFPKVSVIICTYNQQDFVAETLESVLAQTYPSVEIIVTDDGSTDDTPQILKRFATVNPNKIKLVFSEKNTGIPSNINRGLAIRSGDYLVVLDGDDVMLPDKVSHQVALLQAHSEATGCYHDVEVFESESGQILGAFTSLYNGTAQLKQGNIKQWWTPRYYFLPSSIMCRSSACPTHGYDQRLKYLSEVVFFVESLRNGQLLALDEILIRYRRHARNVTDDAQSRSVAHEYELMAYAILEARYPELHSITRKMKASCMIAHAIKCYREGDAKRGCIILRNAINDGALLPALATFVGVSLFRKQIFTMTSGQPFRRLALIKKVARFIVRH